METLKIKDWQCDCLSVKNSDKLVYMIYPALVPVSESLLEKLSSTYKVSLGVIYVPADKWNDVLTPWPEPGEAKGFPPFAGEASSFLKFLFGSGGWRLLSGFG